jgi:O-methyltransferase
MATLDRRKSAFRPRALAMGLLDRLHLGNTARRGKALARHAKNAASSRVLWGWKPLVPEHAFEECCQEAVQTLRNLGHVPFGDYLEFGVSRGTSLAAVHEVLCREGLPQVRLIGFDSFEGMPPEALTQGWRPGDFRSTISTTRRYLRKKGVQLDRVVLVKGWFKDTLTRDTVDRLGLTKASLIMIDCDIYSSSREALWFCEPLIRETAVIFFDDWGWRSDLNEIGQKEAFTEFMQEFSMFSEEPLPAYLPQARAFLIRRRPH